MALTIFVAERLAGGLSRRAGLVLALLPLVFTGKALARGELYGPSDLYYQQDPWKEVAAANGIAGARNPILSDLAFANLPWRAAVRDAVLNGRAPLWNRFVLGGTPLLATGSAAVFHPATWLGIHLPVALSWTFSCAYAMFLALLCAYVFLRDFVGPRAALVGAIVWGFSTYLVFWNGWSVGMSTGTLPLLLLGLRRLAHGRGGVALTIAGFLVSFFGGHPESTFHVAAIGAAYLSWELAPRASRQPGRLAAVARGVLLAALLALLLGAVQLLPLLEGISHSAEYRARGSALAQGAAVQSVPLDRAAARLLPDLLPFAHGIWGRSIVQESRRDGAGMPLGYAGAVVFPLALLAFAGRPRVRGRAFFLACVVLGFAYGASFPGLLDVTARLPGFALALNYRLVLLSALGLAGLAAIGVQALEDRGLARGLAVACAATSLVLVVAFAASRGVFRDRELWPGFVRFGFAAELLPVAALGALALVPGWRSGRLGAAAAVLLVAQRGVEAGGTYPTLPASTLAPPLPTLAAAPLQSPPGRLVAAGSTMRPNGAALYGLEDVRGYESIVLDRLVDTYPLWCAPQHASFNRVDDLSRPFLRFLNVRWAIAPPDAAVPAGWEEQVRGADLAVFRNPAALPRAFAPRSVRRGAGGAGALADIADFAETALVAGTGPPEDRNGEARVRAREVGDDLLVEVDADSRAVVVTSLPDWPGWTAEAPGGAVPTLTVNHAFVGFVAGPGRREYRLRYRPTGWAAGLLAFALGVVAVGVLAARRPAAGRLDPPPPTPEAAAS